MKRAIPLTVALAAVFVSCEDDVNTPPPSPPATEVHVIRDVDYIANKYFYFDDPAHFIGPRLADAQVLVFRSVLPADIIAHPEILRFPAWIIPDSVGDGQSIRDGAAMLNMGRPP